MKDNRTRRQFLKEAALIAAAVRAMGAAEAAAADKPPTKTPKIKLGKLEVSRLILGSNPFFGFAHGNPQASGGKMRKYYTDERIMAVLDEAAEQGIEAVWTPCYDHWIRLWNRYRKKGGKLKVWIGQPDNFGKMKEHITACAKNGGKAICVQGCCVDSAFSKRRYDLVRQWLELIHRLGLPAGIATHQPTTHLLAEKKKLPTDFYHQCLYQPENYSPTCRDQALATIRKLDKPVVVYKALAAGRLAPKEAFPYVLKHLRRKDGICVGVFPQEDTDQIAENAALMRTLSGNPGASRTAALRDRRSTVALQRRRTTGTTRHSSHRLLSGEITWE